MRETTTKNKRMNELSFDDLYIEDDKLYPNIRQALGKLKVKTKKAHVYILANQKMKGLIYRLQ